MSPTMKAYRFTSPDKGLELKDIPVPAPAKNQLLVRVSAVGLCHTDHNIVTGKEDAFFWKKPITLGHEVAGIVVDIGEGVTKFKTGDRVVSVITSTVPPDIFDVINAPGVGCDGGFAEYVIMNEPKTLPVPQGISLAQAAVGSDAVATAYSAVVSAAKVSAGQKVAIVGLGGLGLSAVQIARLQGATVYGVETNLSKFTAGAQAGVYTSARSFAHHSGVRFDAVIDFVGNSGTISGACKSVKTGGTVVVVGLFSKEVTIDINKFITMGVTLRGSAGSAIEDVEKSMQLLAEKKLDVLLQEIPFSGIKEGIDRLGRGEVVGRLYADPTKA